ncbi:MAG TPA: bifunctional pyr operon transcriptional regulator/uracil phosphoribosyltransferase PyrR [Candidatus Hydrogenedentes bacterium]|nr:bifunctional pyr operon transcriptional regulator/uracil phosphoribosyltransferase PyrR [Candidatus Hydrogenedentota bacterium]HPG67023.1 bifunctional pyr operon transcriptional regulator/uracil phosphoribosyltransferase PyrR [Candidatus Hydrogenedentota bacterium]
MNEHDPSAREETVVMTAETMAEACRRLAREIAGANTDMASVVLLGILRRGRPLADRLARLLAEMTGVAPPVGSLATTLYRDDLRSGVGRLKPGVAETYFEFPINGATVILVDDVIAAGRTIRAALDELMDYGRPRRIQLACLVDRGGRELPIQPDYLGWPVSAGENDRVVVRLAETDGQDMVVIRRSLPEDGEAEEG